MYVSRCELTAGNGQEPGCEWSAHLHEFERTRLLSALHQPQSLAHVAYAALTLDAAPTATAPEQRAAAAHTIPPRLRCPLGELEVLVPHREAHLQFIHADWRLRTFCSGSCNHAEESPITESCIWAEAHRQPRDGEDVVDDDERSHQQAEGLHCRDWGEYVGGERKRRCRGPAQLSTPADCLQVGNTMHHSYSMQLPVRSPHEMDASCMDSREYWVAWSSTWHGRVNWR